MERCTLPLAGNILEDLTEAGGAGRASAQSLVTPATSSASYFLFKGTVSWDRYKKNWQKFTELGLTKGRGWLGTLDDFIMRKFIYYG